MFEPLAFRPLGELVDLRMGGTPSRAEPDFWDRDNAGHPWVSIGDIKGKYISRTKESVTKLGARAARLSVVPPGVPIMSFKLSMGRAAIPAVPVYTNEAIVALFPKPGISFAKWLYYSVPRVVQSAVTETAVKGQTLNLKKLRELPVPTPSTLEEQRRIAEILDALDVQISTTRACMEKYRVMRYGQVRDIMKDELAALAAVEVSEVVRRAASGNVPLRILDDLIVGIDAGSSPSVDDVPAGPGEWGVLKVSAIGRGVFRPQENKVARDKSLHVASYCVRDGDLLISRANTPELVGLACIVQNTPPHLMLSDKTLRLHLNYDLVSCKYVNLMLGVAEVRRQIEIAATGTSGSMKNISQESIRKLAIPWADQEKQDLVVRMDAAYLEQIEALNRQIKALEQLKQGLAEDLLTGRVRVPEAEAVVESL